MSDILPKGRAQTNPITVVMVPRSMRMHTLAEEQLEAIASGGTTNALYLTFFGIAVGAFLTLLCTVYAVDIPDPKKSARFFSMMAVSGFVSLLLLIKVIFDAVKTHQQLKRFREAPSKQPQ